MYPFNPDAIDFTQLIKRQKLDADHEECVADVQSNQFLERFERYLDVDVLQSFKNSELEWTGKREDTSLFEFWRKIGGCVDQQNGSVCEANEDVVVISNNDVVVEYLDTTYAECFEIGKIIEIVDLDNVVENDSQEIVGTKDSDSVETEFSTPVTASNDPKKFDNIIGDSGLNDDLCSAGGVSCTDFIDSNNDASSNDEETTADLIDTNTSIPDVSHIPKGFPKCFQDALFWPGRPSDTSAKSQSKRKPKEKIPAVLTSEDCVAYLKKKEEELVRLEKEKAERKVEREMKKFEKQKHEEEKKKMLLEKKLEKQRKDEEKEKQKNERQLKREAQKIEKQQKEEEKKAKVEHKKKNETKKPQKT